MIETAAYTFVAPLFLGLPGAIQRTSDNAMIPLDLDNMDYQRFLAWVAAGNEAPEGWTGPTNPTGATL